MSGHAIAGGAHGARPSRGPRSPLFLPTGVRARGFASRGAGARLRVAGCGRSASLAGAGRSAAPRGCGRSASPRPCLALSPRVAPRVSGISRRKRKSLTPDTPLVSERKPTAVALRSIYAAPSADAASPPLDAFERGRQGQKFPSVVAMCAVRGRKSSRSLRFHQTSAGWFAHQRARKRRFSTKVAFHRQPRKNATAHDAAGAWTHRTRFNPSV